MTFKELKDLEEQDREACLEDLFHLTGDMMRIVNGEGSCVMRMEPDIIDIGFQSYFGQPIKTLIEFSLSDDGPKVVVKRSGCYDLASQLTEFYELHLDREVTLVKDY